VRRTTPLLAWLALLIGLCGCATAQPVAVRPAHARVPAGFAPEAFSGVSDRDFWLLGTAPCRAGRCTAIVRTGDAGRSFTRLSAPKLPVEGTVPVLELADTRNGFAFVPDGKSALYATHDGGSTWQRQSLGGVIGIATGGGTAYVVTAHRLETSPVSSATWTATTLPFVPDGGRVSLTIRRSKVWLLGTPAANRQSHDRLARSVDSGRTFTTGPGPCYAGLGGDLSPAAANVVWAVCPTGMLGSALRSTDGGIRFTRLTTPALVNSAQLAPASGSTAVLFGNGAGSRLLRTTDGGARWTAARVPRRPIDVWWVGFTGSSVGYALVQTRDKAYSEDLWRTTDGGAHWSELTIP
jgi:photosystem II stability/assembly factor-like uncharacterized protein